MVNPQTDETSNAISGYGLSLICPPFSPPTPLPPLPSPFREETRRMCELE